MKRIILLSLLVFSGQLVFSQSCLPNGITFSTQEQIDSFQVNYLGCTEIEGGVHIEGNDITNLLGLSVLTSIGWNLTIKNNPLLSDFYGLENLITAGYDGLDLYVENNDAITDFTGFGSAEIPGGFTSIYIIDNDALTSLSGLENISCDGSESIDIVISNNDALVDLFGFPNLGGADHNYYEISNNDSLESLIGIQLPPGVDGLRISNNDALVNLEGLESIFQSADYGGFSINGNDALTSFDGLENITSINSEGGLSIKNNSTLSDISALNGMEICNYGIAIQNNPLLMNINFLNGIQPSYYYHGQLTITSNDSLSVCDVQYVCSYLDQFSNGATINDNAPGCESKQAVIAACEWTGINNGALIQELTLHPNPIKEGVVHISYKNTVNENLHLACYNTFGQSVYNKKILPNQEESRVFVNRWKKGIYLVVIYVDDTPVASSKFSIQ